MNPAIVLLSTGRAQALACAVNSLETAAIPSGVAIVVLNATEETGRTEKDALAAAWSHGPLDIRYASPAGDSATLQEQAAGLATEYGAVIVLPDDVVVSPQFYRYIQQAVVAYAGEDRVAAVSLFSLAINSQTNQPFIPLPDRGDSYFISTSWPDGTLYTAAQWANFLSWRESADATAPPTEPASDAGLYQARRTPPGWLSYLATTQRVCAFPRDSLVTAGPGGDPYRETWRRPPLNLFKQQFDFIPPAESVAVYDEVFEILPDRLNRLTDRFAGLDYSLDLYATRDLTCVTAGHLITSRRCTAATETYAKLMRPMEANLIAGLAGDELCLVPIGAVDRSLAAARAAQLDNNAYFRRHPVTGGRQLLAAHAAEWRQRRMMARRSGGR